MTTTKYANDSDMLQDVGMDGEKWTKAFRQTFPDCNVDDGTMLGWFCNAIMAGYDTAQNRKEGVRD